MTLENTFLRCRGAKGVTELMPASAGSSVTALPRRQHGDRVFKRHRLATDGGRLCLSDGYHNRRITRLSRWITAALNL